MIITEDSSDARYQINSYEPGQITINNQIYYKSLIVSADQLLTDWEPQSLNELKSEHLDRIFALTPKIVLLGTGKHFIMPSSNIISLFHQQKIGIEYMNTKAACRTYMALIAENRPVTAALLIS